MNRKALIAVFGAAAILLAGRVAAHGPTLCAGTVYFTGNGRVTADLRFGVGILHKYVDPNDDAVISEDEWTSATPVLRALFGAGVQLRAGDVVTTPTELKLFRTSGAEIQIVATLDPAATATLVHFAMPVLRKLPAAPPAQLSIWQGEDTMARPPELLWFDKELPYDRSKRVTVPAQ